MSYENKIILKEKEINLSKLGINFTLNDQQIECLNKLCDFVINKNDIAFTLMGYAGTGKTSIVKIFLKWLQLEFSFFDYSLTAPTHRAKYILESLSGEKTVTIHSVLGLSANVEIEKLDHRNIQFDKRREPKLPKNLLIVDESSMVNDFLYNLIIEKVRYKNSQVLFIGDPAQLKPVKQSEISNVFKIKEKYELTKVERQKDGNPLGEILLSLRSNILSEKQNFELIDQLNDKNQGLLCLNSSKDFIDKVIKEMQVTLNENLLNSRVLAFKNERVSLYNKLIRKNLGFEKEYVKNELLMAYSNVGDDFINSCDYIIDSEPIKSNRYIAGVSMIGYEVDLMSIDRTKYFSQFILSKENTEEKFSKLAENIEDIRLDALNSKKREIQLRNWRKYFEVLSSFISKNELIFDGRVIKSKSVDYGYSHTVHKSQGSTYNNVFIDYRDINSCFDVEQRNQLKYVAFSRPTEYATIFH